MYQMINKLTLLVTLSLGVATLVACPGPEPEPSRRGSAHHVAKPATPEKPATPVKPADPVDPEDPTDPVNPVNPEDPTDPVNPVNPEDPTDPVNPVNPEDPIVPNDPIDPVEPGECDIETAELSERYQLVIVPGVAYVQDSETAKLNWNVQIANGDGELAMVAIDIAQFQVTDGDDNVLLEMTTTGSGTAAIDSNGGKDPLQLDPDSPSGLPGNPGGLQNQMAAPLAVRPLSRFCDTVVLRARLLLSPCEKVQAELVIDRVRPDYCEEPELPVEPVEPVDSAWRRFAPEQYVNAELLAATREKAAVLVASPGSGPAVLALAEEFGIAADKANLVNFLTEVQLYSEYAIGPESTSSDQIKQLQVLLVSLGYNVSKTGAWDAATGQAVIAFKQKQHMAQSYNNADGTWAINEYATSDVIVEIICTLEDNCAETPQAGGAGRPRPSSGTNK